MTPVGRWLTQRLRSRNQSFFRRIDPHNQMGQSLCQRAEAITVKKGGRYASTEGKLARWIRAHARTSRLRWEVDAAENLRGSILLHPLLRSRMVRDPTVRERSCFSRCL